MGTSDVTATIGEENVEFCVIVGPVTRTVGIKDLLIVIHLHFFYYNFFGWHIDLVG